MATTTTRSTATTPTRALEAPRHFHHLLSQRELFGRLAEYQRSHHGYTEATRDLDSLVTALTEELESLFPNLWAPLEADLLVEELGLLHDPAEGPMLGCGLCHEQKRERQPQRPMTRRSRPARQTGQKAA
jgi:hypothetical protein